MAERADPQHESAILIVGSVALNAGCRTEIMPLATEPIRSFPKRNQRVSP
jgi:hypothetical protein